MSLPPDVESLVLVHRRRETSPEAFAFSNPKWNVWETCVRRIAIGHESFGVEATQVGDEIYIGRKAYGFLLEVVCGLRSPVKGETEVHGQYRQFLAHLGEKSNANDSLSKILQNVHAQARRLREAYLRNLGSQSYGSLARRKLRECATIDIVGGGQLVHEILPWLMKLEKPTRVWVRDTEKMMWAVKQYPELEVLALTAMLPASGGLVVAAPVSAQNINQWLTAMPQMILDFRAESAQDRIWSDQDRVLTLADIFSEIENTRDRVEHQVREAQERINQMTDEITDDAKTTSEAE